MANSIKWAAGWVDRSTVLTTELNSLANNGFSAQGSEIANQTNLDTIGYLRLSVTFGTAPSSGGLVAIYMLESPDSDGYGSDGGPTTIANRLIAIIPVFPVTSAQVCDSMLIELHPAPTKFFLENRTGVAFPASGSTLKLYTSNYEIK